LEFRRVLFRSPGFPEHSVFQFLKAECPQVTFLFLQTDTHLPPDWLLWRRPTENHLSMALLFLPFYCEYYFFFVYIFCFIEPYFIKISCFSNNYRCNITVSGFSDLLDIKFNQRITNFNLLTVFYENFIMFTLQLDSIKANMNQHFYSCVRFQANRMAGREYSNYFTFEW